MYDSNLENARSILKKYDQEHLLCLYDELNDEEKNMLISQILKIDFENILNLYDNSMKNDNFSYKTLSPLRHFEKNKLTKEQIDYYTKLGEEIIHNEQIAVITMAGGQGSRLRYHGPKGTYMLDLKPRKKSLFEIMCDDIKSTNEKYNISLPWFVMTSTDNQKIK